MSISSDEINLLVQHYLQELGYKHTAFSFGCESKIPTNKISERNVQPGALVYLIQKGIMFANIEAAAEKALEDPDSQFARQLNLLRSSLQQSTELVDEISSSSRKMKVFPVADENNSQFYLDKNSSLILQAHKSPVTACAWDLTSRYLATGSESGSIVVWNCEYNDLESSCIVHHVSTIQSLRPTDKKSEKTDEEQYDVTVLEWNFPTESEELILASGTFNGSVRFFNVAKGSEIESLKCHSSPVVSLKYSPNYELLLSAGSQGTISVIRQFKVEYTFNVEDEITEACWGDDHTILVAAAKSVIKIQVDGANDAKSFEKLLTVTDSITQLIADPGHDLYAAVDNSGFLTVVDSAGANKYSRQIHSGTICCASWSRSVGSDPAMPFVPLIVTGGTDCAVKMTNLNEPISKAFDGHSSPVYSVDYGPKGNYIASAAKDVVNIWALVNNNRLVLSYKAESNVVSLCWSPNGQFLIICLFSGDVAMIDFEQLC